MKSVIQKKRFRFIVSHLAPFGVDPVVSDWVAVLFASIA